MEKHYSYGSGMIGCLYDYGPKFAPDIESVIQDLTFIFENSVNGEELDLMAANLRSDGYHKFTDHHAAGAHYCELTEHSGPCPEDEEE